MSHTTTVIEVVQQLAAQTSSEREQAVALHDYVREQITFGFNPTFDAAEPDQVLAFGVGHCIPKSRVLVALLRATGLPSHLHLVAIPKDILKGVLPASRYWMLPSEVSHSYVEVKIDGGWQAIDSHIVDTPLLRAGQALLAEQGRRLGYGVRVDSTNVWDGHSDAFSQFHPSLVIADHGRVEDIDAYFLGPHYRHRVLGLPFNTMFALMGEKGVAPINAHIDRLRQRAPSAVGDPAPVSARASQS